MGQDPSDGIATGAQESAGMACLSGFRRAGERPGAEEAVANLQSRLQAAARPERDQTGLNVRFRIAKADVQRTGRLG